MGPHVHIVHTGLSKSTDVKYLGTIMIHKNMHNRLFKQYMFYFSVGYAVIDIFSFKYFKINHALLTTD